jgi:hypothetical protein
MESVKQRAAEDCRRAVTELSLSTLRGHVGWFEAQYARERGVTGKDRGRYQRAFHRALKMYVKQ